MSEVVNLDDARSRREQPDPSFVSADRWGRPLYLFSASYSYDGLTGPSNWTFEFWAYDWSDAQKRLDSIKAGAVIEGQVYTEQDA